MVLVKSFHDDRIRENLDIFDFDLTAEDMNSLASLDKKTRYSSDPEDKEWLEKIRNM